MQKRGTVNHETSFQKAFICMIITILALAHTLVFTDREAAAQADFAPNISLKSIAAGYRHKKSIFLMARQLWIFKLQTAN